MKLLIATILMGILLVLVWPLFERSMCMHGDINACFRLQIYWGQK